MQSLLFVRVRKDLLCGWAFTCTQMVLNVALKAASFDCTREEGVGRLCKWLQQPHLLRPHQSWGHSHEQLQRPSLHNTSEAYTIHVNVKSCLVFS